MAINLVKVEDNFMKKSIMVLGGYGGVGKLLSKNILKHTDSNLVISGRSLDKAESFAALLKKEHPTKQIQAIFADAADKNSLIEAFKSIHLVIVAATAPDQITAIAEAAIETETDMIDIFVRGDVIDKLNLYRDKIIESNRIFITQAGFHPGLPAPFIKYASRNFDNYDTANIVMVMNALFEKPESTYEIIYEIGEANAKILVDGIWKKASYKDALNIKFSDDFGVRQCYPLQMRELYPLQKELGISNMGVYSAGFNSFIDNFVFPLTVLLQFIKKGFGLKTCAKLMHWGINQYHSDKLGVEFKLLAKGLKNGDVKNYSLEARSSDAFDFTAVAVTACLKQYLDNSINRPGLFLMGNVVDYKRIIEDLKQMGVHIIES